MKKLFLKISFMALAVLLVLPSTAFAYEIIPVSGINNEHDFAVSSGRVDLSLNAGEQNIQKVTVMNRMGEESRFKVAVEDFGVSDENGVAKFFGDDIGPYSLKNYLKPEINEFTLKHGDQITFDVVVNIPKEAPPGGLYGAVLISNIPIIPEKTSEKIEGQMGIESRIGVLFYVRVNGQLVEDGELKTFSTEKSFFTDPNVKFNFNFENKGNIHLKPSGKITITNMLGTQVGQVKIDPYFILPKSTRILTKNWGQKFMLGKYTANIEINRGYEGGLVDKKSVEFWVVPSFIIYVVAVSLLLIFLVIIFEIIHKRRKRKLQKKKLLKKK